MHFRPQQVIPAGKLTSYAERPHLALGVVRCDQYFRLHGPAKCTLSRARRNAMATVAFMSNGTTNDSPVSSFLEPLTKCAGANGFLSAEACPQRPLEARLLLLLLPIREASGCASGGTGQRGNWAFRRIRCERTKGRKIKRWRYRYMGRERKGKLCCHCVCLLVPRTASKRPTHAAIRVVLAFKTKTPLVNFTRCLQQPPRHAKHTHAPSADPANSAVCIFLGCFIVSFSGSKGPLVFLALMVSHRSMP